MWFHTELRGRGYDAAQTTVAQSDKVAGPYAVVRSLRPDAGTWPLNMPEGQKEGPIPAGVLRQTSKEWLAAATDGGIVRRDFKGGQTPAPGFDPIFPAGAVTLLHAHGLGALRRESSLGIDGLVELR